jgi:hypothetical protein
LVPSTQTRAWFPAHPTAALTHWKVAFPLPAGGGVLQQTGAAPVQGARPAPQATGVTAPASGVVAAVAVVVARLLVVAVVLVELLVVALLVAAAVALAVLVEALVAAALCEPATDVSALAVVAPAVVLLVLLLVAPGVNVGAPTCSSSELSLQAATPAAAEATAKTIPTIFIQLSEGR